MSENVISEAELKFQEKKEYARSLPLASQVNELFILNINGSSDFEPVEYRDDKPMIPGGYIFFSFNLADTSQGVKDFTESVINYCKDNDCSVPIFAIDQEGGDVARLRKHTSTLPSAYDVAHELSLDAAYELYENQARQMKDLGFNMNIAPVAEPLTEDNKEFLGDRSFGTVRDIENYGSAFVMAFQASGVATVLKHFPGNTNVDPHSGLPNITLTREQFEAEIIKPFAALCEHKPAAILMSHALTQNVEPEIPACLSKVWIDDIIRGQMKYDGLVISDDIFMSALADNGFAPDVAVVRAIEAGCDMIMISEKRFKKAADILIAKAQSDENFAERIAESCARVLLAKDLYGTKNNQANADGMAEATSASE